MECNNCSTDYEGNFCPHCGQRPNSGRIIFKESAKEVLEHYFDFDAPLFRTVVGLTISPAKLIKEYIFGKRKSYAHPFRYFILVLAIYLILKNLVGFDPIQTYAEATGSAAIPNPDSDVAKASNYLSVHINSFLLIFAFTLSLFSRIFFPKSKFTFVEYSALSFFSIAQYLFFSLFVMLLSLLSPKFFLLNYVIVLLYPIFVLATFHEGNVYWRIFKSVITLLLSFVFYVFTAFMIAFLIVSN